MIPICIADTSVVTALGGNLEELWHNLLAGKTGIRPVERFSTKNYLTNYAACIDGLHSQPGRSLVVDMLERLLAGLGPVPEDCRLITATTKGGVDNLERLRRTLAADSADVMLSEISNFVGRNLGLKEPGININAACASSTIAVARGAALIASGQADAVFVCCLDLVSEFVFSGFSSLQALSSEPSRPFDRRRAGLSLGEGAAALLLMSAERAKREGRSSLGSVVGWGVANDANHITAPAKDGCGLIQAILRALQKAQLNAEEIAAISAHGTGTVYNDMMELTAFNEIFGERKVPVHSVKGAIGHTLGAAGGIEVALGLKTLESRTVPSTVGFDEPEKGAEGRVCAAPVSIKGDYLLSTNSGFGGINAALVLGKAGGA